MFLLRLNRCWIKFYSNKNNNFFGRSNVFKQENPTPSSGLMNFGRIISSMFDWISVKKAVWYVVFFGISIPVLLLFPQVFQNGLYPTAATPITLILYDILYLCVILGIMVLIQFSLSEKKESVCKISIGKIIDTFFLVFAEFFYLLVWNIHFPFRAIQFLLLIASAMVYYYFSVMQTDLLLLASYLCFTAYFIIVVYNAVRIFFTTTIFCHRDLGIKETIKESWAITHNKFYETFCSIALCLVMSFVMFSFISLALGAFASLVLKYFFIESIAFDLGSKAAFAFALAPVLIAYHHGVTETYLQLSSHKNASTSVKRILAHRVLHKKAKAPVRKLIKKKRK